jgi:hypothetical protein
LIDRLLNLFRNRSPIFSYFYFLKFILSNLLNKVIKKVDGGMAQIKTTNFFVEASNIREHGIEKNEIVGT